MTMIDSDTTRSTVVARTPRSGALATRAEQVMPGGESRVAGYHAAYPLVLDSGEASTLDTTDKRRHRRHPHQSRVGDERYLVTSG
jgi:hypothetical protein